MAESLPKCMFCQSYDELVVVDYSSLMKNEKASSKDIMNEFDVIYHISKNFLFENLGKKECLYKISKNNTQIKICRKCYLEKHPETICPKCGKITFTFLSGEKTDPFSLKTLCHCWIENVQKHIGKWEKIVEGDMVKYICHQKKPEKTFMQFYNDVYKTILVKYKSFEPKDKIIKINDKICKLKLFLIPQLVYEKKNGEINCKRIDEQCWMEIEYKGMSRLIHMNFYVSIDDPIELDLSFIQFINDEILKLNIDGIEYQSIFSDEVKQRDCGFCMKTSKYLTFGDIKILEYYHDIRCCCET